MTPSPPFLKWENAPEPPSPLPAPELRPEDPAPAGGAGPVTRERETAETRVRVTLGAESSRVETPIPMLTHLLEQLAFYWGVGLDIRAEEASPAGDGHHLTEDVALVLGRALDRLLGDRRGLRRYGQRWLPMDEALVLVALDLGGRPHASLRLPLPPVPLGCLLPETVPHFFRTLAMEGRLTLHLRSGRGSGAHHLAEAAFKATGLALAEAMSPWEDGPRSTKGVLR